MGDATHEVQEWWYGRPSHSGNPYNGHISNHMSQNKLGLATLNVIQLSTVAHMLSYLVEDGML